MDGNSRPAFFPRFPPPFFSLYLRSFLFSFSTPVTYVARKIAAERFARYSVLHARAPSLVPPPSVLPLRLSFFASCALLDTLLVSSRRDESYCQTEAPFLLGQVYVYCWLVRRITLSLSLFRIAKFFPLINIALLLLRSIHKDVSQEVYGFFGNVGITLVEFGDSAKVAYPVISHRILLS